jgi:hypothetical protein
MSDTSSPLPSSPLPSSSDKLSQSLIPMSKKGSGRVRHIIIPLITLLLGIVIGIVSLVLYGLSGDGKDVPVPGPGKTDISVVADRAFITTLITTKLRVSGLPGTVKNVQVDLASGDQLTINGDDAFSMLGFGLTKHFTIVIQPYINNCSLQIHITHADLSTIPVTSFVTSFESNVNQQFRQKPTSLPQGFQYCATGVSTQPAGMFLTYSAIPV